MTDQNRRLMDQKELAAINSYYDLMCTHQLNTTLVLTGHPIGRPEGKAEGKRPQDRTPTMGWCKGKESGERR